MPSSSDLAYLVSPVPPRFYWRLSARLAPSAKHEPKALCAQLFKAALMVGDGAPGGWSGKADCMDHLATSQVCTLGT